MHSHEPIGRKVNIVFLEQTQRNAFTATFTSVLTGELRWVQLRPALLYPAVPKVGPMEPPDG